jgi:anaerobic selenocysteine-containing dehydrogenase
MGTTRTVHGACNLCEAICGLRFTVEGDRITAINGDPDDPLSRGHICPKAIALGDLQADPARLRRPVRRTAEGWAEISWDDAYDLVVRRLLETRERHGPDAVAVYLGNPSVHNYGILTHGRHFLGQLRTRNRFSATSVDQLPHQLVAHWLYGHQLLIPIPDLDHTSYFLVFGANPLASNGSLMTVPDVRRRLGDLRARGGKLVVFDPRRTETAAIADEHHFVRPGTDAALLLAMLHCVLADPSATPTPGVDGLDEIRAAVAGFTPERAAAVTGVGADVIRRIAGEFAAADGAACYGRIGVSIQRFGALAQWAIQLLNLATGNIDRPGGALFTSPAVDLVGGGVSPRRWLSRRRPGAPPPAAKGLVGPGHYDKWRSRVRGLPEFAGELPVAALAEEILTPGDGQVRALVTVAGNPVLSTPNGAQLDRALAGLDFMVAVDFYVNETTRHADVILPPTTALEHDHYDLVFHALAVRNTARYSAPVLPKPDGARHDWEIFTELARRYRRRSGAARRWRADLRRELMMRLRPHQLIALGLRTGPYRLRLRTLRRRPSGVDLGPLRPSLPAVLHTPDRRVHAAPPRLLAALRDGTGELLAAPADGELRLIGRRHLRSNNSWMHGFPRLTKGRPRHHLLMHPDDLAARGLHDGERVRVSSRVGQVEVEVAATADVMPGVVSLPHGWSHTRVNDLTDDAFLDELSGNAALNGVPVTVERP